MAEGFYASIERRDRNGVRRGLLLGPHPDKASAEADVGEARRLAEIVDPRAIWDAYGVTRIVADRLPDGQLNHLRGQPGPAPLVTAYRHNQPGGTQ